MSCAISTKIQQIVTLYNGLLNGSCCMSLPTGTGNGTIKLTTPHCCVNSLVITDMCQRPLQTVLANMRYLLAHAPGPLDYQWWSVGNPTCTDCCTFRSSVSDPGDPPACLTAAYLDSVIAWLAGITCCVTEPRNVCICPDLLEFDPSWATSHTPPSWWWKRYTVTLYIDTLATCTGTIPDFWSGQTGPTRADAAQGLIWQPAWLLDGNRNAAVGLDIRLQPRINDDGCAAGFWELLVRCIGTWVDTPGGGPKQYHTAFAICASGSDWSEPLTGDDKDYGPYYDYCKNLIGMKVHNSTLCDPRGIRAGAFLFSECPTRYCPGDSTPHYYNDIGWTIEIT